MNGSMDRRAFLYGAAAAAAGAHALPAAAVERGPVRRWQGDASPWPLALNTSVIRTASIEEKIAAAAGAGYDAVELWTDELEGYEREGGDLLALGRAIQEAGLFVANVNGLWNSMPPALAEFERMRETTSRRMRMAADVGARSAAALPTPDQPDYDLRQAAARYRDLLHMGREEYGLVIAFAFALDGPPEGVSRLGQAAHVALEADDPDACLVCDAFHLYRGGSGFHGLRGLHGGFLAVFHICDAPESPPRERLTDPDRVFPGDGILPLEQALRDLDAIGYSRALTLTLANPAHWEQDPAEVAETGLRKLRGLVTAAGV